MDRLTARTDGGIAYLVNVKQDEQEVDCKSRNTAQCIIDSWERLAAYEDTGLTPEVCAEYKKFEDEVVARGGMTFGEWAALMHAEKARKAND